MESARPDPDVLLAMVQAEGAGPRRGTLRIYFGYAPGVGKTYAMLQAARQAFRQGRNLLVGYVEPHARPDTQALLEGLPRLPLREVPYRGMTLREFDVDAALQRRPEVVLVDELAHTNAAGSRHEKRWQDVRDLLDAGIDVWTTLNVQHIESLNDIVGQVTGVVVRETIPDQVFELADECELIDLQPEELLQRLSAGKVYMPAQAQRAIERFFQRGNLAALRELSLRQTAQRVHADVESARRQRAAHEPWATNERLLACVGAVESDAQVIRTTRRLATALSAPWLAVTVDLVGESPSEADRQRVYRHLRLAESLGAETVTLPGQRVAPTILEYARSRNVTKVVVARPRRPHWQRLFVGTVVDELIDQGGAIDIVAIQGTTENPSPVPVGSAQHSGKLFDPRSWAAATVTVGVALGLALAMQWLEVGDAEANTAMLFLAAVAWIAYRLGHGPAVWGTVLSVLTFDFFFIPPLYTFAVSDLRYLVTFVVMMAIGVVISTLTSQLRAQVERTRWREQRTAALYQLGRELGAINGPPGLVQAVTRQLNEIVPGEVAVYLRSDAGLPVPILGEAGTIVQHPVSGSTAQWVIDHNQLAGAGTNTLPNAPALFLPIRGSRLTHGALAIQAEKPDRLLDPELRGFLEACGSQLALALDRDQWALAAAEAELRAGE